jgi:PAS domain S-box-containing protein
MKIKRSLILVVSIGILWMAITVLSLGYIMAGFSSTTRAMEQSAEETRDIARLDNKISEIVHSIQSYVLTGNHAALNVYRQSLAEAERMLSPLAVPGQGADESPIRVSLGEDLVRMRKKADRIFSLNDPTGSDRILAANLLLELAGLHTWMEQDITRYQQLNTANMKTVMEEVRRTKHVGVFVFLFVLLVTASSLTGLILYLHRKINVPLLALSAGTEEISRGNLEYRVEIPAEGDILRLAEHFNEMARRLRISYAELEQKLYERTRELASLDAVALTLSQAGTLRDMLDKSLLKILDSMAGISARGGVYLCEPSGEQLRLMAHQGMSAEFIERESVIKMGDCLCGTAAQTGELVFTGNSCSPDLRDAASPDKEANGHIIIPIKSRGIVLGVIFLYPERDFTLKPSDVQMLDTIGAQLGMAVENLRFYAEVKESSEKYWDLFENSTDILFTIDDTGRLTATNRAAENFSHYSKVELFGKSILDVLSPTDAEVVKKLLQGGTGRPWREFEVVKKDGSRAFVEASARRLFRNRRSAGYQVSARDVTEQKKLREMLVQAERLVAIGQVGIAVRHEINNPLTTVIGNIELLLERYEEKDRELGTRLQAILTNALRIAEIVKQLQVIKNDKVVDYVKGVKMTDLRQK